MNKITRAKIRQRKNKHNKTGLSLSLFYFVLAFSPSIFFCTQPALHGKKKTNKRKLGKIENRFRKTMKKNPNKKSVLDQAGRQSHVRREGKPR